MFAEASAPKIRVAVVRMPEGASPELSAPSLPKSSRDELSCVVAVALPQMLETAIQGPPAGPTKPTLQEHAAAVRLPTLKVVMLAGQLEQSSAPTFDLYWPVPQAEHPVTPSPVYPALHRQSLAAEWPPMDVAFNAQVLQTADPMEDL
jgi:hypothetical protein